MTDNFDQVLADLDHETDLAELPTVDAPALGTTDIETEVLQYQDAEIVGDELI